MEVDFTLKREVRFWKSFLMPLSMSLFFRVDLERFYGASGKYSPGSKYSANLYSLSS